jgi:hypothetical protein
VIDVDGAHGANQLFSGDLTGDLLILGIVKTLKPYGWHVYIPPQNLSNSVHLGDAKDTDYRGRGGYVVAPPTCINDTTYTWHALYQPDGCTTCEYCDLPLSKWDTPHTTHSSCGLTTPPSNIYPRYTNETLR